MAADGGTIPSVNSARNALLHREIQQGNQRLQDDDDSQPSDSATEGLRLPTLQGFAKPKFFLLVFCILGILQGACRTYFIGILSTVERRFAIPSKTMGLVLAAQNISPVLAIIAGCCGGTNYNKPLWLFLGMCAVAASCGLCSLPHFIFGSGTHLLTHPEHHTTPGALRYEFCSSVNRSIFRDCLTDINVGADATIFIMFLANLLSGFGSAAFYVIGVSYIDENVKKKDSPMYFGTMFALRLFGPSAGFFLASYSLSHYEDPYADPRIEKSDPRWIGAWWLGYVILGLLVIVFSVLLLLFPNKFLQLPDEDALPSKFTVILRDPQDTTSSEDMKTTVKRLIRSPAFVCQAASLSLTVNGLMGYLFAMPKYMEAEFRRPASAASLFSGSTSLVTILAGVLFGGAIIRRFKPKANLVSAYIVCVDLFLFSCFLGALFLSCVQLDIASTRSSDGELNLLNTCNRGCGCTTELFQPVCDPVEGLTYFSPCFAGCKGLNTSNSNRMLGCRCLEGGAGDFRGKNDTGNADTGVCFGQCSLFVPFVAVLGLAKTIFATSRVGTALIGIRSIHPKDKRVALTLLLMLGSIFGFVPYSLVYGAIMDSCCLVWNTNCGARGNCWLYDADRFRYFLHGTSMTFVLLGATFSALAYVFGSRQAAPDQEEEDDDEDVVFMRNMGHPGITHSA